MRTAQNKAKITLINRDKCHTYYLDTKKERRVIYINNSLSNQSFQGKQINIPWKKIISGLGAALCAVYILNPTAGLIELIPDNIPVIGNLDEAALMALLIQLIKELRK